ncbi:hypothetical protein O3M35_007058 [Rhynocoris fuscipes]|uniref:NADH dehydrogenase subunit 4L n=1 Tax=Rhynocoris fuscipes TaxID=488301 RepID=A0AAW1D9C8_9HEMI
MCLFTLGLCFVKTIAFVSSLLILIFHFVQNFVILSSAIINRLVIVSVLQDAV